MGFKYADVLVPLAVGRDSDLWFGRGSALLTYLVGDVECIEGDAVGVEVGSKADGRFYTGLVWRLHDDEPSYSRVRSLCKRLYSFALLDSVHRRFWDWIAEYYMCSLGDVMRGVLPSLIKPRGADADSFSLSEYVAPKRLRVVVGGDPSEHFTLPLLTSHQSSALEVLEGSSQRCSLLHGVTGSGKTELYIHLIASQLSAGRDVLMLVPEIALTTQLIERLGVVFGDRVTAYHSKVTPRRRTETFMQLSRHEDGGTLIVGARSALFLPLHRLGLIIVDEEHDPSYKQSEPAPMYHARDCAQVLAGLYDARVVLGSATPSLESWLNAQSGKFGYAFLSERFGDAVLPRVVISDSRVAGRRGERRGHFNFALLDRLTDRLLRGEQSMLFQNRRGFAPYVECEGCGWVAQCPHCNVSLTLHKSGASLRCHYCDYATILPSVCPSCGDSERRLAPRGFGTEKLEDQLMEFLPDCRVVRLDRDTASSATAFNRILGGFKRGDSDVMVGTQMIAKGFDFERVTLVGILNADNMLNNPDFRAEERAFSLMMQVAGRAGRRKSTRGDASAGGSVTPSEVVIQTSQPSHRILSFVASCDYDGMARTLLAERHSFFYPPYSRLIEITVSHRNMDFLYSGANALGRLLIARFGGRVRGPVAPPVDRVGGVWRLTFILKVESGSSSSRARSLLRDIFTVWRGMDCGKSIRIICNVDPQ